MTIIVRREPCNHSYRQPFYITRNLLEEGSSLGRWILSVERETQKKINSEYCPICKEKGRA